MPEEETFKQKQARVKREREEEKATRAEEARRKREEAKVAEEQAMADMIKAEAAKKEADRQAMREMDADLERGTKRQVVDTEFVKTLALPDDMQKIIKGLVEKETRDLVRGIQKLEAEIFTMKHPEEKKVPPEYRAGTPAFKDAILKLVTTLNPADHPGMDAVIIRAQKWKRTSFVKDVLDLITIHMQQGGYV